ncbi:MAG: T9SS type A sorting domain-containing protein, partial [Candidatus Cloacimonetes bacterium]|nr:T9SS type A sorting domain-containing protein [Candidatus Cloacimonadota bacterium]
LTSFTATLAQETTANIQWTVESESGIVGYYVYRSETDYSQAVAISDLIHADNTPFSHSYSFIDTELEYEHTYNYWLESINSDGTTNQWGPQEITLEGAPAPQLPQVTSLEGNYPNPFNPSTMLKFSVKENEEATLTIFNAKGQQVLKEKFAPGYHEYEWNADAQASGLYFYRLSSPSFSQVRKMMLLK